MLFIAYYIIVFIAIQVSLRETVLEPSVYRQVFFEEVTEKYMKERNYIKNLRSNYTLMLRFGK